MVGRGPPPGPSSDGGRLSGAPSRFSAPRPGDRTRNCALRVLVCITREITLSASSSDDPHQLQSRARMSRPAPGSTASRAYPGPSWTSTTTSCAAPAPARITESIRTSSNSDGSRSRNRANSDDSETRGAVWSRNRAKAWPYGGVQRRRLRRVCRAGAHERPAGAGRAKACRVAPPPISRLDARKGFARYGRSVFH